MNALTVVCGLMLLFGLLAEPIVNVAGGSTWANVAWLAIAVAGSGLMVWLVYQLFKRGYSNLRG